MLTVGIFVTQKFPAEKDSDKMENEWVGIMLRTFVKDCGFKVADVCVCANNQRIFDTLFELANSYSNMKIQAILLSYSDSMLLQRFINEDRTIEIGTQKIPIIAMPRSYPNNYRGKCKYDFLNCKKIFK